MSEIEKAEDMEQHTAARFPQPSEKTQRTKRVVRNGAEQRQIETSWGKGESCKQNIVAWNR